MNKLHPFRSADWPNKVPAVTLSFWIIKIMSTTVGEMGADFLAVNAGWGQAVTDMVMAALLAAALSAQLHTRRHTPWIYWLPCCWLALPAAKRHWQTCLPPLTNFKPRAD